MNDQTYQDVLVFYRTSIRDERLLDVESPLPPLVSRMLKVAAELVDRPPSLGDPDQSAALRQAVTQFAEKILFIDQTNFYRILGLNRDAEAALIKDHYKWLNGLLFPVTDVMNWNEADSQLLNRAYSVLRDPRYRKAYNEDMLNKSGLDQALELKREAVSRGGGQGTAAEAMASALGQAQFPEGEEVAKEQTSGNVAKEKRDSSFIAANIHRVNQAPFAQPGTNRVPEDLMPGATATTPKPGTDASPASAGTSDQARSSRVSLPVMIGSLLAVGLAVLIFLDIIPVPFVDDQAENRSPPVSAEAPQVAATGQVVARSEAQSSQVPGGESIGGSDAAVKSLPSAAPVSSADTQGQSATENQSAAPAKKPLSEDELLAEVDRLLATVPNKGSSTDSAKSAATTEPVQAKTARAEQQPAPKPVVPSTPKPAPEKHTAEKPSLTHNKSITPSVEKPATVHREESPVAVRPTPAVPHKTVSEPVRAEAPRPVVKPKPVVAPPPPVKRVEEVPAIPAPDLSTRASSGSGISSPVQPPAGEEKLATAAPARSLSSVTEDSGPTAKPEPLAISEPHLNTLIKSFITSYEAGDLDIFMSLFSEDAHTKAQKDREAIRGAYNQFFQGTRNRLLRLHGLQWTRVDKDTLVGRAPFILTLIPEGQSKTSQYSGTLIFHVENRNSHLLISQFDYEYQGNK